jgi:hypothetical protein
MLRRNPVVVGGGCCSPCWAKAGAASDIPSNAIANKFFVIGGL